MPAPDPNTRAHLEWLGYIQPNGLVVSAPALVKAGALLNQGRFLFCCGWCLRGAWHGTGVRRERG